MLLLLSDGCSVRTGRMMRAEQLAHDPLKELQRKRKSGFEDKALHLSKAFLYTCLLFARAPCLTQYLVLKQF